MTGRYLTALYLRQLRAVDAAAGNEGPFLWQPSTIAGLPPTFLGKPIYTCDYLAHTTDALGVVAIVGDFKSGYRILDRVGFTMQRLNELYSEAGLIGIKVRKRSGAGLIRPANRSLALLKMVAGE